MSSFGSSFASAYNARTAGRESASRTRLAWAQLAEEQEERDKREAHLGKAADSFFKGMPQALSELGISETQFANMSASEKSAAAQGYMQAQTQKQIYQQLAAQQQAQADDQAAFGAVQRASTRTTTVPSPTMPGAFADLNVQTTGTPTAAGVWAELAANPRALRSPVAQPFLRELAQGGTTPSGFTPDQMGVARPIAGVKGRYFVPVSTGSGQVIEDASADTAAEYTQEDFKFDANGNPTHWRVGDTWAKWDPKNTLAPGSRKGTVRVLPPRAPNLFETMFGNANSAAAPAGEAAPAAASEGRAEVVRLTKDGRKAVFDATTKQFLRYADE